MDATELALRNLMARIDGDGGQTQDEFPSLTEAAYACEQKVVASRVREETLRKALPDPKQLRDAADYVFDECNDDLSADLHASADAIEFALRETGT